MTARSDEARRGLARTTSRRPLRIVVLGTAASMPYAGMAWMLMQIVVGLRRLGHDAYYFEITSTWPYDPVRRSNVGDSDYALPYLARVAESFGLGDRWAYRRSYSDGRWFGIERPRGERLLAGADAVLNVAGATDLGDQELAAGHLVYFGTDPGYHELGYARGDRPIRSIIEQHDACVTYGENVGTDRSPLPPLPGLCSRTRQPVLLDLWRSGPPSRPAFTTVTNWRHDGFDIEYGGETYYWSKGREFVRYIDLPRRVRQPVELATGLADLAPEDRRLLAGNGWQVVDAHQLSADPWSYRDYVRSSTGEFTVAKDQYARLRTGWFSERSACYLAAGRPVVSQDTGFGATLPTGEGLFACETAEGAAAAFEAIGADYARHSRAARAIAEEYFRAETVLGRVIADLGL